MCNIAGYVGTKPATPILIDMMRKQEGLDAGFYTGIATIHEGRIHYAKIVGDLDTLLENTNAASLPGTIGFIHSRTPGARDASNEWAHPFTCEKDGEVKTAFIANGTIGCCEPRRDSYIPIAEALIADGYEIKTRIEARGKSFTLSDGMRIHISDLLCQYVSKKILEGTDITDAMGEMFCEMPIEAVGLLLSVTETNAIAYSRMNFPMHVGVAEHGTYMATAPQAFPEDSGEPYLLPVLSSGLVYKDYFTCKRFKNPPITVAPITARVRKEVYEMICDKLREGNAIASKLGDVDSLFEEADCTQRGAAAYAVLNEVYRRKKLKIEEERIPGVVEGTTAPRFRLTLVE